MPLIKTLKNKLGDFWWYSLMIFIACRSGDVIQAFIGLWLVPKYVGQQELGAVLPLQQLCGLFAVPLAALATVFTKYVNTYATRGEYGKAKSFIIDVLHASIAIFAVCIVAAYFLLPHFYLRLNIGVGSLSILILASGFIGNISQLFTNALQGLKKFNTIAIINFISAPIRLVTLLVAMPIRALSGYILGQTTPPASSALVAAFTLRRDLKAIPIDTAWRKDIPTILHYLWPVLFLNAFGTILSTISATVIRQRLPEVESAAYYMLTRFSDIASYIGLATIPLIFPLAAEAHENKSEKRHLLGQSVVVAILCSIVLAILFAFVAPSIFSLNEIWRAYLPYASLLLPITINNGLASSLALISTYELACGRFRILFFLFTTNVLWTFLIVAFMGYDYFRGIFPGAWVDWMASCKLATLERFVYAYLIASALQLCAIPFFMRKKA